MPDFQPAGTREVPGVDLPPMPLLRLADGVAAEDVRWPDLGFAAAYTGSYETFRRLQDEGTIPPGVRFQMQYPTPVAPIAGTFVPEEQDRLVASYQGALFADLDRALARLPHEQIAVSGMPPSNSRCLKAPLASPGPRSGRSRRDWPAAPGRYPPTCLSACTCATDAGHQHFKQPESLAVQVQVANAVTLAASRPVNWFSFTVPQAQRDSDYFAPLAAFGPGRRPSCTSRWCPTTRPARPLAPPPSRSPASTPTSPAPRPDRGTGASAPSAAWAACQPRRAQPARSAPHSPRLARSKPLTACQPKSRK